MTKRAKVELPGCKVNSKAFGLNDGEIDVFLMENEGETDNVEVYNSLSWQMMVFVVISTVLLYQWNFYPLVAVLEALLVLLIPVDTREKDATGKEKIVHVAGYFGQAEGWSLTEYNKL